MQLLKAWAGIEAGMEQSRLLGVRANIAVVDSGGHLVSFARMDEAWLGSIDLACKKARTAALFRAPTEVIGEMSQPGGPAWGVEHSNGGLVTFAGGLPVAVGADRVVGAVGVSGGSVEQDRAIAQAVVVVLEKP